MSCLIVNPRLTRLRWAFYQGIPAAGHKGASSTVGANEFLSTCTLFYIDRV